MRPKAWLTLGLAALALLLYPVESDAGDGLAALQTADPSCPDDSGNIYVDCGNGTVTDNRTGLVWLADASCWGLLDWHQAMEVVAGLADQPAGSAAAADDCGLSDGSSPGEWRLPSLSEWEAMGADGVGLSCNPEITDDQGTGCWSFSCNTDGFCSFSGIQTEYWSASSLGSSNAWVGLLNDGGDVGASIKSGVFHLWPVRGGQ